MSAEATLADGFLSGHPGDAARVLERAAPAASAAVLAGVPPGVAAEVLRAMDPALAARLLGELPDASSAAILEAAPLSSAASVLRLIDPAERERLLGAVREETARPIQTALSHPADSAGALMDAEVLALPASLSTVEARRRLRRRSRRVGNYLYVVDDQRRLQGAVGLAALLVAPRATTLATLMRPADSRLFSSDGPPSITEHAGWRELHALPVVDHDGTLVGVLRRETCEQLREELKQREAGVEGGLGMALAELSWAMTTSTVDEMARALRPNTDPSDAEGRDAD